MLLSASRQSHLEKEGPLLFPFCRCKREVTLVTLNASSFQGHALFSKNNDNTYKATHTVLPVCDVRVPWYSSSLCQLTLADVDTHHFLEVWCQYLGILTCPTSQIHCQHMRSSLLRILTDAIFSLLNVADCFFIKTFSVHRISRKPY